MALPSSVARAARLALRGADVARATVIGTGFDVTAWRLPADDGDWVVRVPRLAAARAVVEAQHCLGLRLEAHGLPVPLDSRLLRDSDGVVAAGLYRFADGRRGDVSGRTGRRRLAHTLGGFLSRLHALDPRIAIECGAKPYEPWGDVYEPMIRRCGPVLPPRSKAWIGAIGERLRAASRALPPLVVVHAALKPDHVLLGASDDLVAVLDFEGARVTDAATDFARLHQHWGSGFATQALERYAGAIDEGFAVRARCYAALDPLELLDAPWVGRVDCAGAADAGGSGGSRDATKPAPAGMSMARRRRKRASDGRRRVPEAFSPFRSALYRRTWIGAALFGMGVWMERLAVGWFVLTVSGSVFLTALSFGLRTMPNLVIGPIAGAASDRLPRDRVLVAVSLVRLVAVIGMGIAALADDASVRVILGLVLLTGGTNAFQTTALQALIADTVPPERIGSAISLTSFGQRAVGGIGALAGGVLLARLGPGSTFLLAAAPLALAAAAFATLEVPRRAGGSGGAFTAEVIEGLRVIVGTPMVRLLLGMMILVEILGFSYNSLLPSVADRVLHVGPEGLGLLTASAALGSMFGTLVLVLVADRWPRGPMLIGVFAGFGLLLLGLAASEVLLLSALMVAGIGAMASMVDALEWMMLQTSVPDRLRGRALGGWNFAIGFGWLGPLVLGGFAHVAGVPVALALGGTLLILVAAAVGAASQRLRAS